ncbi:MAG TPA: ChbG/HpnK family deacetylase [Anaeromyxobacteraceae bacterium]|nr:ChbG/HpnK family deacetylase [Anaeromyxobacteraceae bacterium]
MSLIVNADDLGYDPAISRGICEAHARGIVTSASVMVDTPFAPEALDEAPATLDLGLHVVLAGDGEGASVGEEIDRQVGRFRTLRGSLPTHLDSHRHRHAAPQALPAFAEAARRWRIPLRALDGTMGALLRARGVAVADAFLGDASKRPCWTREALLAAVVALPRGVVELMCHPGYAPTHVRTSFGAEREVELAALCDPAVRLALERGAASLVGFATAFPRCGSADAP